MKLPKKQAAILPDVSDEPAPGGKLSGKVSLNITIPASAMDEEMLDMIKILLNRF